MANLVELGELWVCLEPLGLVCFGWEGDGGLRSRKEEKEEGDEGRTYKEEKREGTKEEGRGEREEEGGGGGGRRKQEARKR